MRHSDLKRCSNLYRSRRAVASSLRVQWACVAPGMVPYVVSDSVIMHLSERQGCHLRLTATACICGDESDSTKLSQIKLTYFGGVAAVDGPVTGSPSVTALQVCAADK